MKNETTNTVFTNANKNVKIICLTTIFLRLLSSDFDLSDVGCILKLNPKLDVNIFV